LLGNFKWNLSLGDRLFYRNFPFPYQKIKEENKALGICKNKLFTKLCFASIFFPTSPLPFRFFPVLAKFRNLLCEKVRNSFCWLASLLLLHLRPAVLCHFLL